MESLLKSFRRSHARDASIDFTPMGNAAGPLLQAQANPAEDVQCKLGRLALPEGSTPPETECQQGSTWTYAKHRPTATWFHLPVGFGGPPNLDAVGVQQPKGSVLVPLLQPSSASSTCQQVKAVPAVVQASEPPPPQQQAGAEGVKWHANPAASPRLLQAHNCSWCAPAESQQQQQEGLEHPQQPQAPAAASPGKLPPPPRHLKMLGEARSTMTVAPPSSSAPGSAGSLYRPQKSVNEPHAGDAAPSATVCPRAFRFVSNLSQGGELPAQEQQQRGGCQGEERQQQERPAKRAMQALAPAAPAQHAPSTPAPQPSAPGATPPPPPPPPPSSAANHNTGQPARGPAQHLATPPLPAAPPRPPLQPGVTPPAASAAAAPGCSPLSAIKPEELLAAARRLRKSAPEQATPPAGHPSPALEPTGGARDALLSAIKNKEFKLRKVDPGVAPQGRARTSPAAATVGRSRPAMAELMRKVQERRAVVEGAGSDSEGEWD